MGDHSSYSSITNILAIDFISQIAMQALCICTSQHAYPPMLIPLTSETRDHKADFDKPYGTKILQ